MQFHWSLVFIPIAIALIWILSRFQIRIMRSKHHREFYGNQGLEFIRDEKSVNLSMPEHVVELIKQGRQDEAMKAMRELSGGELNDGRGTVKSWTSDDGTVHVESRTVTYEADDLPPDAIASIRDGNVQEAIRKLRGNGKLSPPARRKQAVLTPKKKLDTSENVIPTKDEINDPKPRPFPLDE